MTCTRISVRSLVAIVAVAALALSLSASAQSIEWLHDLEKAKEQAAKEDKYILFEVFATWCGPCQQMERVTWKDPGVITRVNENFVPLKIDSDKNPAVASEYGVESLPTIMVLTPKGSPFAQQLGYMGPESMLDFLKQASDLEAKKEELKKSIEDNPDDTDAVLELAKLQLMFDEADKSLDLLERYREHFNQDTSKDTRARFEYQLGLAHLVQEDYPKGLNALEPFLTTYHDHELAQVATEMYGIGTLQYARSQVENGQEEAARQMLAKLGSHEDQPYLQRLAESSIAMLDAIKEKQKEMETNGPIGPTQ